MGENGRQVSPSTQETRWRPSRSGLLNFYRYDDQEFHFHQGRLLLRGNNGSGKSRVLALQLPFLLDGEISPDRVEPDCDKAKRFEWNLLMGKYDDRLGYTWIEFERVGSDGTSQYLTLGCGVRAATGRGVVNKWFFSSHRRVGYDISLCSSQNNPLPKDSLIEVLGSSGRVFDTATAYREEVNHRLYGMPQERYKALIDLLIELRQPKLSSRNLDEKTLSGAMSNSLPPVSPGIIQQVADAMRAMEQDRTALTNLQSAKQSTDLFLTEYRRYARILARRRSEEVRNTNSAYESRHRRLRQAESDRATAFEESKRLRSLEEELSLELAAAEARKTTLESSPQMRSARDLDNARQHAEDRQAEANRASEEYGNAVELLDLVKTEHGRDVERAETVAERLMGLGSQSNSAAGACELEKPHRAAVARAELPQPSDLAMIDAAEKLITKACNDRRADIWLLRDLNAKIDSSRQEWRKSLDRRDEQAGSVEESTTAVRACDQALVQALHDLSAAYYAWFRSLVLLKPLTPEDVLAAIPAWSDENISAIGPVRSEVNRALDNFRKGAAIELAAKFWELEVFEASLQEMTAERDRLIAGEHEPPPSPYTRDAKSRDDRTGAPLWQLCEFVDGVPDNHRAAVEAALEASGILDAWINPDGGVTSFEAFDSFLRDQGAAIAGPTLLEVLRPSLEHMDGMAPHVPHEVVQNILGRIGLNEGPALTWIDVKGRWQLGVLSGRWEKPAAQHIGNAAREAERIRRIRELDAMLDEVRQSILATRLTMKAIDDRSLLADTEANRAPSEHGVGNVIAQRDTQRKQLDQVRLRLEDLEKALAVAKDDLDRKIEHRDTSAADLGLSHWTERLQALDDALGEYRQSLVVLWSAARDEVRAVRTLAESTLRLNRDRDRSERLGQASHDAAQKAAAAASHYQALHETVGAAVEEVQRQLQDARTLLDRIHTDQKQNDKKVGTTDERIKSLAASVDLLTDEIEEDIARRGAAIDRLLRFTKTALIDITADSLAGVGRGEMAVTPAVDLAREIASALADVNFDDDAWNATQKAIHNHIQNLTNSLQRHDYRPEQTLEDDTLVVTAPLHGVHRPMKEFSAILADEIIQRRSLLTAKELELLENYLIQDVAVEMGKLIRDAEDLVAGMNRQLHSRPNSTGMTLRFNWQPDADGPVAFADARKKLLGDHATWSPADRTALGHFLQEQITRARDADASSTWQEQLATALDYRRWHEFHVERRQDNKWVRLNRKTHGTGSGGEKAIALTIPQFAAACAYYDSASPTAPRLILLDEAFVGIDADMRGKCMGLLHEFDLDFVMTSEREWGCYRSMPGLAIYQLSAHAGIDAVLASRWVWNGRERVQQSPVSTYGNGRPPARTDLPGLDATSAPL